MSRRYSVTTLTLVIALLASYAQVSCSRWWLKRYWHGPSEGLLRFLVNKPLGYSSLVVKEKS